MAEIMNKNIRSSTLYPFEKAGHGAFYEVKAGKSTYWIFESSGGAITKTLKRK